MAEFKSEIRQSIIEQLEYKVAHSSYGKYLKRITLQRMRGFTDREVTFDFPVTALVGPNGGGKTTVLGAAALPYEDVPPRRFFAKSGKYDESMKDWEVLYELIDRDINKRIPVSRTVSYKRARWNRTAVQREVLIFGVTRTVPATERSELSKAARGTFTANSEIPLTSQVAIHASRILGKSLAGFNRLYIDRSERVSLFSGQTGDGERYSEFHFGAGEASILRIVAEVEAAEDNCLILIEEIENGLHPIATRRLVEYLINVASRKSCQVIFTTHSNDALAPLPPKAIWATYSGEVLQGKLDIAALRTITGQIDARLAIFVEDEFAERMVEAALRHHKSVDLAGIKIHRMGGKDPARNVNEQHNVDPTRAFPSICILDGDQKELACPEKYIYLLPGDSLPEAHVLNRVLDRIDSVAARLTLGMQLPISRQNDVKSVVMEKYRTNHDRHVIWEQIGEALDFTSGHTVAGAFLAVWAQEYPDEVEQIVKYLSDILPAVLSPGDGNPNQNGQSAATP
ncbi:MAG: AAA family ATPase [Micromonosporaceae bacterium]|nr:AAA family ATPase [Micromonosporaceae bacterium]